MLDVGKNINSEKMGKYFRFFLQDKDTSKELLTSQKAGEAEKLVSKDRAAQGVCTHFQGEQLCHFQFVPFLIGVKSYR